MTPEAAQALAGFIGDGIALFALAGVLVSLDLQRRELKAQREQSADETAERKLEIESRAKRDALVDKQLADLRARQEAAARHQQSI